MKTAITHLLLASALFSACHALDEVFGPKKFLSNGFLQTYVILDNNGDPVEIGVDMDKGLFDTANMPTRESDGKYDIYDTSIPGHPLKDPVWFCCGHEVEIVFPGSVKDKIPFSRFVANYNPEGHGPPGTYTVNHWDLHFYAIKKQERISIKAPKLNEVCSLPDLAPFIPTTCEDFCLLNQDIPCDQIPPSHVNPLVAVEPGMGSHMLDMTAAEFPPGVSTEPFTHTWIFGIQEGRLSFWEPMITTAYFQSLIDGTVDQIENNGATVDPSKTKVTKTINIPSAVPEAGWYPQEYTMEYDQARGKVRVGLTALTWIPESNGDTTGCSWPGSPCPL